MHKRSLCCHARNLLASSAPMTTNDIQSRIQTAASRFTDEIMAAFGEAFASVVSEFVIKAPAARAAKAPAKRARPAAAAPTRAAAPKSAAAPKKGKRERRSENQILEVGGRVIKLLQGNKKGLRIEQINKQLGTTTRQLARPILKLLSAKKIRKSGERRATTYYA